MRDTIIALLLIAAVIIPVWLSNRYAACIDCDGDGEIVGRLGSGVRCERCRGSGQER